MFSDDALQSWFGYVYGMLISWMVLMCQMCVYVVDYYQPFEISKDEWLFGDRQKTTGNLLEAFAVIGVVLCCDLMVYVLSYDAHSVHRDCH